MIRIAYLLALVAVAAVFPLVLELSGATAILFVFVGMPALAVATALYLVGRWREGAFQFEETSHHR
jgi:hypothetical protein